MWGLSKKKKYNHTSLGLKQQNKSPATSANHIKNAKYLALNFGLAVWYAAMLSHENPEETRNLTPEGLQAGLF
jgi:hypothetical protein